MSNWKKIKKTVRELWYGAKYIEAEAYLKKHAGADQLSTSWAYRVVHGLDQ